VGDDPGTAIFEWSAPEDCATDDLEAWAQANPALGHTISADSLQSDHATDAEPVFRTEVLCQRVPTLEPLPLTLEMWQKQTDEESAVVEDGPVVLSVEMALDHNSASIGFAGWRDDGLAHVGLLAQDFGTEWLLPGLLELINKHKLHAVERGGKRCQAVVIDPMSPAVALVDPLRKAQMISARRMRHRRPQAVGVGDLGRPVACALPGSL